MNLMSIWTIQIWMVKETKKPPSVFKFSLILPWIFTICSTWTLPMLVSSFVFVIDLQVTFGSQRNLFGFIVQHLKLTLILPPIPWNKAKLLNASWKWLWVSLIIKIAFLGATWYKRCLLEMVLLVRAGCGWQGVGMELGLETKSLWICSEELSSGVAQWPRVVPSWVSVLSYTSFRASGLHTPLSLILLSCTEGNQKYHTKQGDGGISLCQL